MTPPPKDPDIFTRDNSAPLVPQDYISVLTKVIDEATRDPAQLRRLVYALASNFLKPERKPTNPPSDMWQQATAMFQLEHARRELERAIEAIEKDAAFRTQASKEAGHEAKPPPNQELPSANPLRSLYDHLREVDANPSEEASPLAQNLQCQETTRLSFCRNEPPLGWFRVHKTDYLPITDSHGTSVSRPHSMLAYMHPLSVRFRLGSCRLSNSLRQHSSGW